MNKSSSLRLCYQIICSGLPVILVDLLNLFMVFLVVGGSKELRYTLMCQIESSNNLITGKVQEQIQILSKPVKNKKMISTSQHRFIEESWLINVRAFYSEMTDVAREGREIDIVNFGF